VDGYQQYDVRTFIWSAKAQADGHAPTIDHILDLTQVVDFELQVDTTAVANASTDIDIDILRTLDHLPNQTAAVWDTLSLELVANHPDAKIKTYHITSVAGGWGKLRLDNNAVGAATVTVIFKKRTRRS